MLPEEFVNRMRAQLNSEADDFLAEYSAPYVKSLRFSHIKNPTEIYDKEPPYSKIEVDASRISWENRGIYYYEAEDIDNIDDKYRKKLCEESLLLDAPGKSPLHAAGAYYIQEASAMISASLLDIKPSRSLKVLDLCAAPGGKSTQIADYMEGLGLLVCNEIVPQRAKILSENIERMGVSNALVISADPNDLVARFPRFFDRILVDAPCSGEGMFRKHPEACDEWSTSNVDLCANRQDNILDCAAAMLAPGGRIVYSTCTFAPQEDEGSALRFIERHPEFVQCEDNHRIFPHRQRGEGHFATAFSYRDSSSSSCEGVHNNEEVAGTNCADTVVTDNSVIMSHVSDTKKRKKQKNKGNKNNQANKASGMDKVALLEDFAKEYLNYYEPLGIAEGDDFTKGISDDIKNRIIMFGDKIYLAPEMMPDIHGLTVYRCGLLLGQAVKDRFEPDHAFAMALKRDNVKQSYSYACDSAEIAGYLRGMTIGEDGIKGWCLICVEGISVGWGKLSNGVIKNHYPKGLRIMD